jgi:hypothetical protein
MKSLITLAVIGCIALSASGCVFSQAVPTVSATVAASAPAACSDLAAAGALTAAIAQQIIAANPNNAKVDAAAQKVINGAPLVAGDCQVISTVVQLGNATVQAASTL